MILAVPRNMLDDVVAGLGNVDGKILVDVSGGMKRAAADGYLELIPGESDSERIQSRLMPGAPLGCFADVSSCSDSGVPTS